ncbi:aldehyde dehydrogenase family protein [Streptomyces sp. NPDC059396]|uniref:aldehyde dehydrogenase family protein n=1 Tax=Streptomyces sp. NPDC059396 TaxID=3346819 RepID=UPI00368EB29B
MQERQDYLQRLADAIDAHADELADAMSVEYGAIAAFTSSVVNASRDWYRQAKDVSDAQRSPSRSTRHRSGGSRSVSPP